MRRFLVALFAVLLCTLVYAQGGIGPGGLFSEAFWYLIPLEAAVVTAISASFVKWLKIPEGWWRQFTSWLVSAIIVALCWIFQIFVIPEPHILNFCLTTLVLGLVANGFYDIPTIRGIIEKIWKV